MAAKFISEPFKIEIKDGCAILSWDEHPPRSVPLRVLRIEHERVGRALAEYDAHKAEVRPIFRKEFPE